MGFAEDAAGGFIAAVYSVVSMNWADKSISDDASDGLIATHIDAEGLISTPINSTYFADTNVSYDAVDGLMMLMC